MSESLSRRLREEAEVNAALSQVSVLFCCRRVVYVWPMSPPLMRDRRNMLRRCSSCLKEQKTRCSCSGVALFCMLLNTSQVLQEELAKFKQQSEKARVQKLQQVRACGTPIALWFDSVAGEVNAG